MPHLQVGDIAPGFELPDHTGKLYQLSEILKRKHALLVFNIGFA